MSTNSKPTNLYDPPIMRPLSGTKRFPQFPQWSLLIKFHRRSVREQKNHTYQIDAQIHQQNDNPKPSVGFLRPKHSSVFQHHYYQQNYCQPKQRVIIKRIHYMPLKELNTGSGSSASWTRDPGNVPEYTSNIQKNDCQQQQRQQSERTDYFLHRYSQSNNKFFLCLL